MSSLFARLTLAFVLVIACTTMIIAVAFFGGVQLSFRGWREGRGENLADEVQEQLTELVGEVRHPTARQVQAVVEPLLRPDSEIVVYDQWGVLLFATSAPFPMMRQMSEAMGPPAAGARRRAAEAAPPARLIDPTQAAALGLRPIAGEEERAALFFRAVSRGFLEDAGNRELFRRVAFALLAGVLISGAAGFTIALLTSTRIGRRTQRLATGLTALAEGKRDLQFDAGGPAELRAIAASAQGLQERLAADERARTQWAQDVAHDLRTPVTAMRVQIEAMADGVLLADREHLWRLLGELDRMQHLVSDLGSLTRLESPEFVLDAREIIFEQLLEQVRERFSLFAERARKPLAIECSGGELTGDRELLLRAVSNLVDNAIKYGKSGTITLRIAAGGAAGTTRLVVDNHGEIEGDPERFFARLARAEPGRTSSGSGLGLPIVRAIATVHGGTAAMTSKDGLTSSWIELPS